MPKVGLFVTCLVDALRPQIGFAAARLLEQTGAEAFTRRRRLVADKSL